MSLLTGPQLTKISQEIEQVRIHLTSQYLEPEQRAALEYHLDNLVMDIKDHYDSLRKLRDLAEMGKHNFLIKRG